MKATQTKINKEFPPLLPLKQTVLDGMGREMYVCPCCCNKLGRNAKILPERCPSCGQKIRQE